MTDAPRTPTSIDKIADEWVDTLAELDPSLATYIGRDEFNDRYADYSPEGTARLIDEARSTLAAFDAATPVDSVDEITKEDVSREIRQYLSDNSYKGPVIDVLGADDFHA